MKTPEHKAGPVPECPRCGYDLSGAVAAWPSDRCPLEGVCSECGLRFPWEWLLGNVGQRVSWLVEARRPRRGFRKTWFKGLRARAFWRVVPMALPFRYGRLFAFAALHLVAWHGLFSLTAVVFTVALPGSQPFWAHSAFWKEMLHTIPWPYTTVVEFASNCYTDLGSVGIIVAIFLISHVAMSIVYFTMIVTFGRAKLRQRHILRGMAYGMPAASVGAGVTTGFVLFAQSYVFTGLRALTEAIALVAAAAALTDPAALVGVHARLPATVPADRNRGRCRRRQCAHDNGDTAASGAASVGTATPLPARAGYAACW